MAGRTGGGPPVGGMSVQTKTLMFGGIAIVGVALAAAVYLRPIQTDPTTPQAAVVSEDIEGQDAEGTQTAAQPTEPQDVATSEVEMEPNVAAVDGMVDEVAAQQVGTPDDRAPLGEDELEGAAQTAADAQQDETEAAPVETIVDNFRFEPDGGMLVSGLAPAGVPLAVMIDGTEVDRVEIGADGVFIVTQFLGYAETPREMTLVSDPDGAAIAADRRYVLAANPEPIVVAAVEAEPVPDAESGLVSDVEANGAPEAVADAEPEAATEDAQVVVGQDVESEVGAAEEPVETANLEPEPNAPSTPAILAIDSEGVDVIQPAIAADAPPEVMSSVALDTITYDLAGDVILSGRAPSEGFVQVYVNNAPVSRLPVAQDGTWRTDLPDVDTGVYTLRIDEVDEDGAVVSRIETPFLREDPADVAEAMAEDVADPAFTIATRTVQPGATLWAIAEERYGSGVLYVNVFEANKDRIRDPDLIYPGQVFMLPDDSN